MNPIDGSVPIGGIRPAEPVKNALSIEPPRKLTIDETPASHSPSANQVLKSVTSLTSETGRRLLGEAIRQGAQHLDED